MGSAGRQPQVIQFGDYTLDLQTAELRRNGNKIILQDQPFLILKTLLDAQGQLVSRDELTRKLWPNGTFVDFDQSLNKAVARLREALGDNADEPRFIETLPRKGYRWIAALQTDTVELALAALTTPTHSPDSTAPTPGPVLVAPVPDLKPNTPSLRSSLWRWEIAALVAVFVLIVLAFWLTRSVVPKVVSSSQLSNDGLLKTELVNDESRLYFTEIVAGHTILSQVSTNGGEPAQILTPFNSFRLGGLSPDGTELLLAGSPTAFPTGDLGYEFPLWILPLPSGSPRRVGDILANDANWSRDGQQIVYSHGHELFLCNRDGSRSTRLAGVSHYPLWPKWSPNSDLIRFTEYDLETNGTALWEVSSSGKGLHRVLADWDANAQVCCGNWTADGKYYVFLNGGNVWSISERGGITKSRPAKLTFGPLSLTSVVPSRDGRKLFVVGQQRRAELVRYDATSRQFVPFLSGISGGELDYSKDGQWIAYTSYPDETLWRCRPDGTEKQQITQPPLRAALPRWSPDGTRLVFMAANPGQRWRIFFASLADDSVRDVLPNQSNIGDPTWSPDGQQLAFGSLAVDASAPPSAIQILNLQDGKISKVPGSDGMFSPRWSPDGHYLLGLSGDSQKLMLYDLEKQQWSTLANQLIGYPTWAKDSKSVYFDDTSLTANPAFYRVNLSDHALRRVVSLKDIRQFSSEWPFGSWTGLASDGSPLVQRDISTQEIYALDMQWP